MRSLFFLLLLTNIVLFGWGYRREGEPAGQQLPAPPPIGELRLLNELSAAEMAQLPKLAETPPPPAVGAAILDGPPARPADHVAPPESTPAAPAEPSAPSPAQPQPEAPPSTLGSPPPAEPRELAPAPPEEKKSEAAAKEKEAVHKPATDKTAEHKGESKAVVPEAAPKASTAAKVVEEKRRDSEPSGTVERAIPSGCGGFGPIKERSGLAGILADLMQYGIAASVQESKQAQELFSLTTPTILTTVEAQRVMAQLQSRGFRSLALLRTDDGRQYISLGDYPSRAEAEQYAGRMRGAGFSAEVKVRQEVRSEFWLEFPLQAGMAPGSDGWKALRGKYGALGPQQLACGGRGG